MEFKPALDLLLHAIKQSQSASTTADILSLQNVNTLVVTNFKDTSDQTSPKQSRPTLSEETLNVQESIPTEVKTERNSSSTDQLTTITTPSTPKNVPQHLPYTGANLDYSEMSTIAIIAGQKVQLIVDTGACLSVIDEQFLKRIYGQSFPKMTDGYLSSVLTVNRERVPVLGKITIPIELDGSDYLCDFHVMQHLAYDAILGRDFLQQNQALIDLYNNKISFQRSADVSKHGKKHRILSTLPVLGTLRAQPMLGETIAKTSNEADSVFYPNLCSQKGTHGNKRFSYQPLLVLLCLIVSLLTAFNTHLPESNNPAAKTTSSHCVFQGEKADGSNAGLLMITMSRIHHKEPYKVPRGQDKSKISRASRSFVTTRNGVEIHKVSEYVLPDSVGVSEESITHGNQIQVSPLPIVLDLPKQDLQIQPSPVMNFKAIEHYG